MNADPFLRAPFPWFGGKSKIADVVWRYLGDVENYVEPFFGSGANLLLRPHRPRVETVNDADGMLANFWRAIVLSPEETAHAANWPVNECDLHARHIWLLERRESLTSRLMADPEYHDAKIAGWWVWGRCSWIGSGWCSDAGAGPWGVVDGEFVRVQRARPHLSGDGMGINRPTVTRQLPHLGNDGRGINKPTVKRQLPHLSGDGQGINKPTVTRQLPHLGDNGQGVHRPPWADVGSATIAEWFSALSSRLRHVRVCCGDWSRVMGRSVTYHHLAVRGGGTCGVFLDPPYAQSERDARLYAVDAEGTARDVRKWCAENGHRENLRIVLAGYSGEGHEDLESAGWRVHEWTTVGGLMGSSYGNTESGHRERLWISPHCLSGEREKQMGLF